MLKEIGAAIAIYILTSTAIAKFLEYKWEIRYTGSANNVASFINALLISGLSLWTFRKYGFVGDGYTCEGYDFRYLEFGGCAFCGYLCADLLMNQLSGHPKEWDFIIHHLLFLILSISGLTYKVNCLPCLWLSMGELSTIFLCLRHGMLKCEYTKHSSFRIVSRLFAITFFISRIMGYILGLCHFILYSSRLRDGLFYDYIFLHALIGAFCLNCYWMTKILRIFCSPQIEKRE